MNMKIDHAIAEIGNPSALGPSGYEYLYSEEAEHIRLASLNTALRNLEGVHRHLCPRQVLGARIALFAGEYLDLELPREDKRLFVFVETDGCALDGIAVTTGANVGKRTMRILDFGKVAATFVDTKSGEAVRIVPRTGIRSEARNYAPEARNRWIAQLNGYQVMPPHELLLAEPVQLTVNLERLISRAGVRVNCKVCGEEIMNEREVVREGMVLCRSCAGDAYFERLAINDQLLVHSFA
jgi:formylmethanofuran dehydrogenase subunit E